MRFPDLKRFRRKFAIRFLARLPISLRLAFGHGILMMVLLPLVGLGVYNLVHRDLLKSVDAALLASAESMRASKSAEGFGVGLDQFLDNFLGGREVNAYARLVDLSGNIRSKSARDDVSLPITKLAMARAEQGLPTFETWSREGKAPLRQLTMPVMLSGIFSGTLVQVGAPLDSTWATLREVRSVFYLAFPAILAVSMLAGYILARRSLEPVDGMRRAADQLSATDLSHRIEVPKVRDELHDLAETFNLMLSRLEDAFERQRRFSSDVSHELRTPLTAIRGETELALRRNRSPEEYRAALETIQKESVAMGTTVEDLLLLARAETGGLPTTKAPVVTSDFLYGVANKAEQLGRAKQIFVNVVDSGAPEEFLAAENYLSLALGNLLSNAVKHSPERGTVTLTCKNAGGNSLTFTVEDQGEGIPPVLLEKIFDPFFRVDSARNRIAGGVGIGLSLARALAKLHGGDVRAESSHGRGSQFHLTIAKALSPQHA
jgi:heavy metal sensor kinase